MNQHCKSTDRSRLLGLYMALTVTTVLSLAPCAMAERLKLQARGAVTGVALGRNGLADGWVEYVYWEPHPAIVARYPQGMPLTIDYYVDNQWPALSSGDLPINRTDAIEMGDFTIGSEFYSFRGGSSTLLMEQRESGLFSNLGFDVRYNPMPRVSQPIELIWYVSGNEIHQGGVFSPSLGTGAYSGGTLSFGVNVAYDHYIRFSVTDVRVVPESSTWALCMCGTLFCARLDMRERRLSACGQRKLSN